MMDPGSWLADQSRAVAAATWEKGEKGGEKGVRLGLLRNCVVLERWRNFPRFANVLPELLRRTMCADRESMKTGFASHGSR